MSKSLESPSLETVKRTCPICEACCGLEVQIDRDAKRIVRIEGDRDDFRSRGYVCPKSYGMKGVYEDPERLRLPIRKREDGSWEEIDWDEAFRYAAENLGRIREQHGTHAVGVFIGEPTGHQLGANLYTRQFMEALATPRCFSSATMDQFPKNVTLHTMFGESWMFVIPDVHNTDLFICMGGNPLASQGSLMGTPNVKKALKDVQARGGRVVVIDPRRTETAEIADEHLFIKPGSDAYFLAAMCQVFFEEDLLRVGRLGEFMDGLEEVRVLVSGFTPEAVATATGIDAQTIRRIAREYAATERACLYGRIGTCTQEFGTLASWLLDVAAILTGHFDERGGMMFPRPATGNHEPGPPVEDLSVGLFKTIGRGLPLIDGQLPAGAMAEEIEESTAGEHRMRALITAAANPVLSAPNGDRLVEAMGELEFMVSVDIYLNETTQHADLILPTQVQGEFANYDMIYTTTSSHNWAALSPQLFEPEPGTKAHWEVLLDLVGALTGTTAAEIDEQAFQELCAQITQPGAPADHKSAEEVASELGTTGGPLRMLDALLRAGPYGDRFGKDASGLSLRKLEEAGGAVDLGPLQPRFPEMVKTPSGRIQLAHPHITADVPRLEATLAERSSSDEMLLIGRRQVRNMNTWLHQVRALGKGPNRCTLLIHPEDAARVGVTHKGKVRVRSRSGEVVAEAEVSAEMMPGVVSLPHGFGHARKGTRTSVASELQPGVNANQLTDELPLDVPSGTHIANGIPVEIEGA